MKRTDAMNDSLEKDLLPEQSFALRVMTVALAAFLVVVPLAYSPKGAEFDGLFDDFYYQPKLEAGFIIIAIAAFSWLALVLGKQARLKYSPVYVYVGAFILLMGLATLLSPYRDIAFRGRKFRSEGLQAFILYVSCFFLFSNYAYGSRRIRILLYALVAGGCVACAYGLLQFFGIEFLPRDHIRQEWWRAFATSGNPDFLGAYLLLVLPFPVIFFLNRDKCSGAACWLWLGAAGLIFSCILATYHRGAWIGMAFGIAVAVIILRKRLKAGSRPGAGRILLLGAVFLSCAIVIDRSAVAMGRPSLAGRVTEGVEPAQVESSSIQVRTYIWRATLPLIAKRPALGWGPDTMHFVFPRHAPKPGELGYSGVMRSKPDKPENLVLQVAYEGGLASLSAFVLAVGLVMIVLWRMTKRLPEDGGWYGAGILVGCSCYLVQQQFSFSTLSTSPVFWSLMGIGLALDFKSNEK